MSLLQSKGLGGISKPSKKVKQSWKKAAADLKHEINSNDNYATFPINFNATSLETTWWELHSQYFDSSMYNGKKLMHYDEHLRDFLHCGESFYESMMLELRDRGKQLLNLGDIVASRVSEKPLPGFIKEKDLKSARTGNYTKINHVTYNLRSKPLSSLKEKDLQKQATDSQNLQDFNVQETDSLKSHLYIEALMYFEPLIDSAIVKDEYTGKRILLRSKIGPHNHEEAEGFNSAQKRNVYYKQIVGAMEQIIPGLDKLNSYGEFSGPNPDVFVNWYLSHIANIDQHGMVFSYGKKQKSLKQSFLKNSKSRWPGKLFAKSSAGIGRLSYNLESEDEWQYPVNFHNVHDDANLIVELRKHIKTIPTDLTKKYKADLDQFVRDYKNVRMIWNHPNEFAEDGNVNHAIRPQVFGANTGLKSVLTSELMKKSSVSKDAYEFIIKYKSPAMIALQLCQYIEKHPYFQDTCDNFDQQVKKITFSWIAKIICLWDMKICKSFVDMVEAGMTVYDWPAWAFVQLKHFKNTHKPAVVKQRLTNNPLFEQCDLKDMERCLAMDGVDDILNRQTFLPCFNIPITQNDDSPYEEPSSNKKRKVSNLN